MSDNATLEFESSVDKEKIQSEVSKKWKRFGYKSYVYNYPEIPNKIFCTLDYFFGYPDEVAMFNEVLKYLRSIAKDGKVFYYRCDDFAPIIESEPHMPILEINAEDIFTPELSPSIGASMERKYLVSTESIDAL